MANDFSNLNDMIYSGRGITVGKTPSGDPFIAYSLTGRSPFSAARELLEGPKTGIIRTSAITDKERLGKMFGIKDEAELKKLQGDLKKGSSALTIYPAITPAIPRILLASNGAQTNTLYSSVTNNAFESPEEIIVRAFSDLVLQYDEKDDRLIDLTTYEPDEPNNTPRISAMLRGDQAALHIVKCGKRNEPVSEIFPFDLEHGKGKLITTYLGGNESPLAPFTGNPLDVLIDSNTSADIAESMYAAIEGGQDPGDNYRVAVAVTLLKPGGLETAIINRVDRGS